MKKFLNFILGKLFKRKIPLANWDNYFSPVVCEETVLNVQTVASEISVKRELAVPEFIHKRELARILANELIPYIEFETTEDIYTDSIRYRGVIRIVKER